MGAAVVQQQQDIMYVDGVASLIGVATPLDLTMAVSLLSFDTFQSSRSAAVVKKGLDGFISTLTSRNFVTRLIMSDGEGAVGAIKDDLNLLGIEVDVSGAGGHVSRVEHRIRTIKEQNQVRAYMSHKLPFTLTALGIAMLVLFCVSRLNYQTSDTRRGDECPRVAFSGRQVDASLDYRVGFGQYVQSTVANTDRSMSARTEDGIAMLPIGNRTGSVKVMNLNTGKVGTRDQFVVLPMPSSVIIRLNEMAAAEGRKITVRSDMVVDTQGILRRADDPTYIRPTFRFTANQESTANSADTNEVYMPQQYASPNHQNLADDIVFGDAPAVGIPDESYFDIPDLDVGPLFEFEEHVEPNSNPDASVPVSPPRSVTTPIYTRYNTTVQPIQSVRRNLMDYYNNSDVTQTSVLMAHEPVEYLIEHALIR